VADERAKAAVGHGPRPGSGRLWHGTAGTSILRGFAGSQLVADGTPDPVAVLEGTGVTVRGLAFDGDGNAWVARADGALLRFAAGELVAGGTVAPDRVIESDDATPTDPHDLAFDAVGDLFVTCANSGRVERFASADLEASGDPTPTVALDLSDQAIGLAFDARGALWVAEAASDTVQRFGPEALAGGGAPPSPEATVDVWAFGIDQLETSVALDHEGALWVALDDVGWLLRYDAPSGPIQTPVAHITTVPMDGGALAFWPVPPRLPIRAP